MSSVFEFDPLEPYPVLGAGYLDKATAEQASERIREYALSGETNAAATPPVSVVVQFANTVAANNFMVRLLDDLTVTLVRRQSHEGHIRFF